MTGEHERGSQPELTSNQPIRLSQTADPICISAPVVSGTGSDEVMERVLIAIPALLTGAGALLPAGAVTVVEVVVLSRRIIPQRVTVMNNRAMIDGVLHKDLLFKVAAPAATTTGVITTGDCVATIAATLDVVVDCPFAMCVPVPGACPGDVAQVNFCIEADIENLIAPSATAAPTVFEERVCIRADVVALRPGSVTITPSLPNICAPVGPVTTPCASPACDNSVGLPTSVLVTAPPGIPGFTGF